MKKIQYSVDHNPSPENDKVIRDGIVDFNHSIINEKATHFSVFAKDKEKIIGGALIWEHTDALYIDVLWADEQYRGKGVGTEIMLLIEEQANKKGIKKLFVETFSFQAQDFYQKQGYTVIGTIPQYMLGYDKVFLKKTM
jgi:N-acetylglutamate synthase-like GNAT family acetyltransferase